jgi:hypothetical protein
MALLAPVGCKSLGPSNHRNWSPDQAKLSTAEFRGSLVEVRNIRNCTYRSTEDYKVDYYDRTFDLHDVESVDFVMVPFPDMPSLAHTMLSFGFQGKDFLAVSVEIRKEKGEVYDPIKGMMNQYELQYVLGDERDLIGLRTNYRLNDVYVYRAKATPEQARLLLVDVLERANGLAKNPEFYHTVTNNCTTNIVNHINRLKPDRVPLDYRVLLPGYSDELAYDLGLIDTTESFARTRLKARVNELAYKYRDADDFSVRIRR